MKTLVKESITLMTEVKQKLMSVKEKYPHLNNVEWEICENVIKAEKLISELEILLKILPKEPTEDKQSEQKEEIEIPSKKFGTLKRSKSTPFRRLR